MNTQPDKAAMRGFDALLDLSAPSRRRRPGAATDRVVHHSPAERASFGRLARVEAPRRSHAEFRPSSERRDPINLLELQASSRVVDLVPIRYGRMLTSPFAFFRGAALIMAADLASTPTSGLAAQLCGDAHLSNFGTYASPERRLVFDINDFDETNPGPWEWDLKRLATSFEVAARDNGFAVKERRTIVRRVGEAYRTSMAAYASMRNLDVWYDRVDVADILRRLERRIDPATLKRLNKDVPRTLARDSVHALDRLTEVVDGRRRIVSRPPLVMPLEDLAPDHIDRDAIERGARTLLRSYRDTLQTDRRTLLEQYQFVGLGRKVVGVGSVGTRAWIALLEGRDGDDPLFLQFKEAQPSVLEEFTAASRYDSCGERVVAGQRLMQSVSDTFLGWLRVPTPEGSVRDYYARQLRDWKGSVTIEALNATGLAEYAQLCGSTLARAHARTGDRIAIAAYLGASDVFDKALGDFAAAYADQNEDDHRALQRAVSSGRIAAVEGL